MGTSVGGGGDGGGWWWWWSRSSGGGGEGLVNERERERDDGGRHNLT